MYMVPQQSFQISDKKYEHLIVILVLLLQSHISIYNYVLWSLSSFFWHKEPGFFSHIKNDKLYIISNLVMVSQTLLNFYMSDSVRQRPQIALATVKDWVLGTFHQLLYNTCHCQNQVQKSFPWISVYTCNYTKLKRIVAVAIFINCWSKTLYVSKSVWVYFLFFV